MAAEASVTNIGQPTQYRQAMAPAYGKATFVADDTDNHDFRVPTVGKSNILIVADNPSNQTLTVSIYGAPDASAEIGESDVIQIGSDLVVLTTASGIRAINQAWPFLLVRATYASGPNSTTTTLFFNAHADGSSGIEGLSGGVAVAIEGDEAHDAVDSGNPVSQGLNAQEDFSSITNVGIGDRVRATGTLKGAQFIAGAARLPGDGMSDPVLSIAQDDNEAPLWVALAVESPGGAHDGVHGLGNSLGGGLGVIAVGARTPGSSEVIQFITVIGATSASRATIITPTSGKKIRILGIYAIAFGLTTDPDAVQFYFGTGAAITTNPATVIGSIDTGTDGDGVRDWGDGEGPIGVADAVVSLRTETETETGLQALVVYREE